MKHWARLRKVRSIGVGQRTWTRALRAHHQAFIEAMKANHRDIYPRIQHLFEDKA